VPEPIVAVEDLRKVFHARRGERGGHGDLLAVAGVSFELAPGGSLGIVGESGSGKTTCARMIVGLEQPSGGSITVGGDTWSGKRLRRSDRARLGSVVQMVFQDPYQSLDRRQRVGECLDECLRRHTDLPRARRRERAAQLLDQVGLDIAHRDHLPRKLSGGQRQRVAIARALAAEPAALILDESVAALDVSIQAQILNLLGDIREQTGIALLFITHDLAVVRQVSDDVIVMESGKVVERGPVDRVLDRPEADYTRRLIDSVPREGRQPRRRLGVASGPPAS
jgi:peptide/nickel transport system ATP-binding protein